MAVILTDEDEDDGPCGMVTETGVFGLLSTTVEVREDGVHTHDMQYRIVRSLCELVWNALVVSIVAKNTLRNINN